MSDLASMSDEDLLARLREGRAQQPLRDPTTLSDDELLQGILRQKDGPYAGQTLTQGPTRLEEMGMRAAGGAKAFGTGAAKGLGDVARGFGVLEQMSPEERAKFEQLAAQYPEATVGEIVGQVAPFLIPGTMAARIASLPVRLAATSALGASEGFVVTKGQGGTNAEAAAMAALGAGMGAGFEVFAPIVNSGARAVARALGLNQKSLLTDLGRPTPEFQAALDKAGISFDDIQQSALAEVRNIDGMAKPDQVARLARFKSEGIEPTEGQLTQYFSQQAREARLMSMASGEAGEPLRQRALDQSNIFQDRIDEFVASLGVPNEAGNTIKEALSGRKALLRREKNKLYEDVANAAPEVANAPILTDTIVSAFADPATKRRIARLSPTQANALDDLAVEFGLNQSPEAVQAFLKDGGEITPLTLGNFEDFRQALNLIERTDQTGAISVLTGPIKSALDEEVALIDSAVRNSGMSDAGVLSSLRDARARVREINTEFSPQAISGRLIETKRDGFTPVIEASQVTQQLLRSGTPVESLQAVVNNLTRAGEKGAQALGDLQAATVLQAMDAALKAPSRKTSGVQTMGGNQFAKALDSIGDEKLALIFQGNEAALRRLQSLKQIALDLEPASAATPKGSAPVILDALKRMGRFPGIAAIVDTANFIISAGADDRAVARALKGRPETVENARQISRLYPNLATALGLGAILNVDTENE